MRIDYELQSLVSEFITDRTSTVSNDPEYIAANNVATRLSEQLIEQFPEHSKLINGLIEADALTEARWGDVCYKRGWYDCLKVIMAIK